MDNRQILDKFDVLYNNIMSDQAPGLDAKEVSVFWNKATLEVLKNHLNLKGNRYAEGFDGSSKRQMEFSSLIEVKKFYFPVDKPADTFSSDGWKYLDDSEPVTDALSIINESLDILDGDPDAFRQLALMVNQEEIDTDVNGDGRVNTTDSILLTNKLLNQVTNQKIKDQLSAAISKMIIGIMGTGTVSGSIVLEESYTIEEVVETFGIKSIPLVVVPINNVEYDTLMSRPYRYPPKSQAWRLLIENRPEFIVHPGELPIRYKVRYVRMPKEVDLSTDTGSEVPEILHDEILQRAVELAKNSWEGTIETQRTLGERSE